ncbi:MAG: ROK family protein [Leeuwenhoekiella sp.]
MELLGVDVGGSGIKSIPFDIETQKYGGERFRLNTPIPRKPKAMIETIAEVVKHWDWKGPVGVGFPTKVHKGKALQHGNLDSSWLNCQVDKMIEDKIGLPVAVINDADAAGLAEMKYGVGHGKKGLIIVVTVGTGIGSGVFFNGELIPNFELGQLRYKKKMIIEKYASRRVRLDNDMSFKKWGKRFNKFLKLTTTICDPDLIIIGGGASKNIDEYRKYLKVDVPILAAETRNHAGLIGAALAAKHLYRQEEKV